MPPGCDGGIEPDGCPVAPTVAAGGGAPAACRQSYAPGGDSIGSRGGRDDGRRKCGVTAGPGDTGTPASGDWPAPGRGTPAGWSGAGNPAVAAGADPRGNPYAGNRSGDGDTGAGAAQGAAAGATSRGAIDGVSTSVFVTPPPSGCRKSGIRGEYRGRGGTTAPASHRGGRSCAPAAAPSPAGGGGGR